jgi:hypothetical protein
MATAYWFGVVIVTLGSFLFNPAGYFYSLMSSPERSVATLPSSSLWISPYFISKTGVFVAVPAVVLLFEVILIDKSREKADNISQILP